MTSMAAAACTQRGCSGTIEDGYCTVWDWRGVAASGPPLSSGSASGGVGAGGAGLLSALIPVAGVVLNGVVVVAVDVVVVGVGRHRQPPGQPKLALGQQPAVSGPARRGAGRGAAGARPRPDRRRSWPTRRCRRTSASARTAASRSAGRGTAGPGRTEGFCPHCRTRYSFTPKLAAGDLVAGPVRGRSAASRTADWAGSTWPGTTTSRDRWVALKGLLDTGDAAALAAAVAERRFLAEVEHPNIVKIYNFVQHDGARYIVMEYVGGKSLKDGRPRGGQRRASRCRGAGARLRPRDPARVRLPARDGLLYNDFKPDNVIQTEEQLKLIDLGGVRASTTTAATSTAPWATRPRKSRPTGPSESDLYTVGRMLAVLAFDFRGYQREYKHRLPAREPIRGAPGVLRPGAAPGHPPEPERRFPSAAEMAAQLTGVLKEVLSVADGEPRPTFSGLFSPELRAVGIELKPSGAGAAPPSAAEVIAGLPVPLAESADPAAGYLATLAGLPPEQQAAALLAAVAGEGGIPQAVTASAETRLALVRALVVAGDAGQAEAHLAELAAADPADWRIAWYTGLCELAQGRPYRAGAAFVPSTTNSRVSSRPSSRSASRPRRPATRWSRGATTRPSGRSTGPASAPRSARPGPAWPTATGWPLSPPSPRSRRPPATTRPPRSPRSDCWSPTAARLPMGARLRLTARLRLAARLRLVPSRRTSAGSRSATCARPTAAWACSPLTTCAGSTHRGILRAALDWVSIAPPSPRRRGDAPADERILGCEPTERALRFGLERGYRALARLAPTRPAGTSWSTWPTASGRGRGREPPAAPTPLARLAP